MNTKLDKPLAVLIFIFGLLFFWNAFDNPSERKAKRLAPCSLTSTNIVTECIRTHRVIAIDYSKLIEADKQVLVFGETHFADAHRKELILAIPVLKKLGFSHLALEALPSSKQYLVTDYTDGRLTRAALLAEIKSTWGHNPESYVQLIDAALAEGIDVVFLDSDREPADEPIDVTAPNWQELERLARARELNARDRREGHWIDIVAGLLSSNNNARVIMLVGSGHTSRSAATASVPKRLSARTISGTTIALEGGDVFYDSIITESARLCNLRTTRFIVRIADGDPDAQGDYHLHLPQTDNPHRIFLKRG